MPDVLLVACIHCGRQFIALRKNKKFCSKSCKVSNHQMKKRGPLKKITDKLQESMKG